MKVPMMIIIIITIASILQCCTVTTAFIIGQGHLNLSLNEGRRIQQIHCLRAQTQEEEIEVGNENDDDNDTIRVRIWRALSSGEEMTLQQLGKAVGERNMKMGDLKHHLSHVEKQAKTLKNKSLQWRKRRGLFDSDTDTTAMNTTRFNNRKVDKLRLIQRRGKKNIVYVKLG